MILTLVALALWMKITATVVLVVVGFVFTAALALFGSGADPNTGVGSRDWIPSAVIFALAIAAIWLLSSCAVVSTDERAERNHVESAEDGP